MPSMSVSDRLSKPLNFDPITRQPGMVSRMLPKTMARPAPFPPLQQLIRFDTAKVRKAFAGYIGPGRRVRPAGAEVGDRAVVAEPADCVGELLIVLDEVLEIGLRDLHQVGAVDGAYGRGARAAADQRHLAESVSFSKPRNCTGVGAGIREHIHLAFGNDVERVARIADVKQDFAGFEMALADIGQNALDAFRRQMPQQIAFRQQLDQLARFLLLALKRVFLEMRGITNRRASPFEIDRRRVIDRRAKCKTAADKAPSRVGGKAVTVQVLRALERKLDGERADERAGGKGENAGQDPLGDRN